MMLFPLLVLGLVMIGAIWLVNNANTAKPVSPDAPATQAAEHPCSACGEAVQADWKACPYCANEL